VLGIPLYLIFLKIVILIPETCRRVQAYVSLNFCYVHLLVNTRGSQKIRLPILLAPNNITERDASLFTYYSLHSIFPHNNNNN
jgi:hypothetical protein